MLPSHPDVDFLIRVWGASNLMDDILKVSQKAFPRRKLPPQPPWDFNMFVYFCTRD